MGSGCVQEEIRFLLSPELIASLLITERVNDVESVLITGSERFSKYYLPRSKMTGSALVTHKMTKASLKKKGAIEFTKGES